MSIKLLLEEEIKNSIPTDECAILLSGGVDSLSVAFAADNLDKKITAYSFCLKDNLSYDYKFAESTAHHFGWSFKGIQIDMSDFEDKFLELVRLKCVKKTHFECVFPFLYVYPQIKEKYVLSGWAADGYFGVSKKANIHYKHTKEKFDKFRDDYFQPKNQAGYLWHRKVSDMYDKIFVTPYLSQSIKEYFYQFTWEELNKPKQKHHVREAFEQFSLNVPKSHMNLQIGSGITKAFEKLVLPNKDLNPYRKYRIMDICRDWHEKIAPLESNRLVKKYLYGI
jgi:asparagine synthetase B (glutamine-hydrolysing)